MSDPAVPPVGEADRWQRRISRERRARQQAEELLEAKSLQLYEANQALSLFAADLERRVDERTQELATAREQAVTLAECDQLTGLANRMRFGRVLEATIEQCQAARTPFALLLIDIDKFKDINDTFGHEAGDVFLRHIATQLRAASRPEDLIARLGGDEFAAIVVGFRTLDALGAMAEAMIAAAREPAVYHDHCLETSCSVGIAVYPDTTTEAAELQRYADLALYRCKAVGSSRYVIYDLGMKTEIDERHLLGSDLKQAIDDDHVTAWFQPIVDGVTNQIVGVEALARWFHPTRGMIRPDLFIKLAEERGLMNALFKRMLRAACLSAKAWAESGTIAYLSVNVSPSQFRSGSLADVVTGILAETGYPAAALTIEITEDLLLFDLDRARVQLEQLAGVGIRIALDDFGIGYSNIAYLRRLPINTIKLDRLLTADVCTDEKARSVVGAIVEIARALELDLVAEGVESAAQALWLSKLGCHYLQGYLFGRPMSEQSFTDFRRDAVALAQAV